MNSAIAALAVVSLISVASPAEAWGFEGHEVTALIAYKHLAPKARAGVDALLASDHDTLTASDFASRATWADAYRPSHPESAAWHFVDIEIDHPDLRAACFGDPALAPGQFASQGPARDCIIDKLNEFEAELANPATPLAERLLAFKFVLHLAGDITQPLHASDHQDRGGNCIGLAPSPDGDVTNLHAFWDVTVVRSLGPDAKAVADRLNAQITPQEAHEWSRGDPATWATDTFRVSEANAYNGLSAEPTCEQRGSIALSAAYQARASQVAAIQLEKAGVRMATLLDRALD